MLPIVSEVEMWLLINSYQHFLFAIVLPYGLKIDLYMSEDKKYIV